MAGLPTFVAKVCAVDTLLSSFADLDILKFNKFTLSIEDMELILLLEPRRRVRKQTVTDP